MAVSKNPMEALIAAAKENEKREKEKALQNNVNSVAHSESSPKETSQPESSKSSKASEEVKEGSKKSSDDALAASFSKLLVKCDKEPSVVVQIPTRLHQEIKLISFLSGTPLNSIVSNILEEALSKNEKEIAKLKKKIK